MEEFLKLKTLIIDNHVDEMVSIANFLAEFDFKVDIAGSGKEALLMMQEEEYGCLVIDIQSSEINGFELTGIIKTNELTKGIPIIYSADEEKIEDKDFIFSCLQSGGVDFIAKPFDNILLMLKIRNHLEFSYNIKKLMYENYQNVKLNLLLENHINISNELSSIMSDEKHRTEELLNKLLPSDIAEELMNKGTSDARHFNDVTVIFTDFIGFSFFSQLFTPQELVSELNTCFIAFDRIMEKYGIEKIKTVGDAYLAASGLPFPDPNHAIKAVNAAIEIAEYMEKRKDQKAGKAFSIRIGLHSGDVIAGIIGAKKLAYDIWGDTVNIAARMEQNSEAGKINISETTYSIVKDNFECIYRGEIEAKNKGALKMYFIA